MYLNFYCHGLFQTVARLDPGSLFKKSFDAYVRWLLKRLNIYPNAYYNYLRGRKAEYQARKKMIHQEISVIYHENNGVLGYRSIRVFLKRKCIHLSAVTVHQYMNKELGLRSITRRKKPSYQKGIVHKVFANLFSNDFKAKQKNHKWCIDFTYLYLTDGTKRYNCSIIDLYDRSVVASMNGVSITSDLAIRTVKKALAQHSRTGEILILHSDQGTQFTSKSFTEFCENQRITQSMSRAGCPYENAPMERYFNTLKSECIYLHHYHNDQELNQAVEQFAYVWYNHIRPHSYNKYLTPFVARQKNRSF